MEYSKWYLLSIIPLIYLAITTFLSTASGWKRLSSTYEALTMPQGITARFGSGSFNKINYNNCLILSTSRKGLYIEMFPLVRFSHPSLLIPWSEIIISHEKIFLRERDVLQLGKGKPVKLLLSDRILKKLEIYNYIRKAHPPRGSSVF
jgi:hypothetical protein